MLVVVALMGLAAGAVALGLGPASRGADPREEAALLVARMARASEEALLAGQPVALAWSERGYRFLALVDGAWAPHSVPLLAQDHALPPGLSLGAAGGFAVTAETLPASGEPLLLPVLREGDDPAGAPAAAWDGATARLLEPAT